MKKILSAFIVLMMYFSGLSAEALLLPHNMNVYLYSNSAGCAVRFDGLVSLEDGTLYVPVIPAIAKNVDELEIIYSYPANKTLKDKPEIITFNNNYSLLKVIQDGQKKTLTKYNNLPDVIKTGVLPQDLLVPNGFFVYENMQGILGNLEIPVNKLTLEKQKNVLNIASKTDGSIDSISTAQKDKKTIKNHKKIHKAAMPKELLNKMFLVTNFDSQYLKIFSPGIPEPIYGLKLKGIIKDITVTPDNKYIIAAIFGKNEIDIVDIENEQIARSIDIEMQPSELAVDKNSNKLYILSTSGKAIFIVNLKDMLVTEKIKLSGVPYRMSLSPDGTQLAYSDKKNDNIYIINLDDEYKNVPVTKCKNIAKIILDDTNRLYALSRTNNTLTINDYNLSKPYTVGEEDEDTGVVLQKKLAANTRNMLGVGDIFPDNAESRDKSEIETPNATVSEKIINVGKKPTEMFLYGNKLFIISSTDNQIGILDVNSLKIIGVVKFPFNGFPRKITKLDNSNLAVITDANTRKYSVLNLDSNQIIGTYSIDIPINSITIINKINNINLIEQTL